MGKTALVLSAGGMFGSYQAGVWDVVAPVFKPDLVVGASIGAVNGWAIAGGCPPSLLIERWLTLDHLSRFRWRVPQHLFDGMLETEPLLNGLRELHAAFQPRIEYALVVTDTRRLRPRVISGPNVDWIHLAASTAILGFFPQHRIEGRICCDGGLLGALPLWAAEELGATRVLAIHALPQLPGAVLRVAVSLVHKLSGFRRRRSEHLDVFTITPARTLGSARSALYWSKKNAEQWIAQGRLDAFEAMDNLVEWAGRGAT